MFAVRALKKQDAFTLIELPVVIAIIALLMGIPMLSLQKARKQAQAVVCVAHTKVLGVAMRMYLDNCDGKAHSTLNQVLLHNAWEGCPIVGEYGPNVDIALSRWRPGGSLAEPHWQEHDTTAKCFHHSRTSNTCWLDRHVSGVKEHTGGNVPTYWYEGQRPKEVAGI